LREFTPLEIPAQTGHSRKEELHRALTFAHKKVAGL
jgi:hypothetical protein